jgi:uncharacterized protein YutE (UPF0331/DUF86 family)
MPPVVQDRDVQKKMIGEHLKAADRFIKASEFPKALEEVTKALGVEPSNMYALAYNERIKVAIEAAKKKEEEDRLKRLVEEQKKAALPPRPAEPPRAPSMPDAKPVSAAAAVPAAPPAASSITTAASQIPADDMVAKIKKEAAAAAEKKSDERLEILKKEFESARRKLEEDVVHFASAAKDAVEARTKLEHTITEQMREVESLRAGKAAAVGAAQAASSDLLKALFEKSWTDGAISADERALLQAAQAVLGFSDADFAAMESATRSSSYLAALREVWKDGVVTPEEADHLEHLRKLLNVPAEEHLKLESQLRRESQVKK